MNDGPTGGDRYLWTAKHYIHDGVQYIYKFPNGYGASVVQHSFSYGGKSGLWEVGTLDRDGHLTKMTEPSGDVEGFLTWNGVLDLLDKIAAFGGRSPVNNEERELPDLNATTHKVVKIVKDLRSDGDNPEYDRALIEVVADLFEIGDKTAVAALLGITSQGGTR